MSTSRKEAVDWSARRSAVGFDYFRELFGFDEQAPGAPTHDLVQKHVKYDARNHTLHCGANSKTYHIGRFDTPTVKQLRDQLERIDRTQVPQGKLTVNHIAVDDVLFLHGDPDFDTATFQVRVNFTERPNACVSVCLCLCLCVCVSVCSGVVMEPLFKNREKAAMVRGCTRTHMCGCMFSHKHGLTHSLTHPLAHSLTNPPAHPCTEN